MLPISDLDFQCKAKGLLGYKHWPMTLHVCERCLKLLCLLSQHNLNKELKYCLVKYWLLVLTWAGNKIVKCNNITHLMVKTSCLLFSLPCFLLLPKTSLEVFSWSLLDYLQLVRDCKWAWAHQTCLI